MRILDVDGVEMHNMVLATPEVSKPHVGKEGEIVGEDPDWGSPLIRLDDGTELYGYECWWEPVSD